MSDPHPFRLYAALLLAVVVISFSGILIKLTLAPALVIAAWRLGIATFVLAPWSLPRSLSPQSGLRANALWVLLSGLALAAHFAAWMFSLGLTSVASAVVLVTTNPLFVGLGSYFLLREKLTRSLVLGVAISVGGGVLIGLGDFQSANDALLGDGLALVGALSLSAHFLIGRHVRNEVRLDAYLFSVYGTAAVALLGAALALGQPLLGYPRSVYVFVLLLALGPQLLGHTTLNWALRQLSASTVAVATLGEPVVAALLATWLLGEPLTASVLAGGGLVLLGVYLSLRGEVQLAG